MGKPTGNKTATGKKCQQEQSIFSKLNDMVPTQVKVYYILWRFAPQLLTKKDIKTFSDLTSAYQGFTSGMTEDHCKTWLLEQNVQEAVLYLLNRLHQEKLIELYDTYFRQAMGGDVQAFKAFIDFSEKFFADRGKDELLAMIQNADIPDED